MRKDSPNIAKRCNVSLKLIRKAADEKWIKQLAFWHLVKSTYGNSVLFDYRQRMPELAKRFGTSRVSYKLKTCYD